MTDGSTLGSGRLRLRSERELRRQAKHTDKGHHQDQATDESLHGRVHLTSHRSSPGLDATGTTSDPFRAGSCCQQKTTDYTRKSGTRSLPSAPRIRGGSAIPPVRKMCSPSSTVMSGKLALARSQITMSPRYRWLVGT